MRQALIAGRYQCAGAPGYSTLTAMIGALRRSYGMRCTVATTFPGGSRHRLGSDCISADDISAVSAAMRDADVVILGGALEDREHDEESGLWLTGTDAGPSLYGSMAWLAALHHRPLVTWGLNVGPIRSSDGQQHVAALVEYSWAFSVCDRVAWDNLRGASAPVIGVNVTADPAFLLEPASHEHALAILRNVASDPHGPWLAVAPGLAQARDDGERWVIELADGIAAWTEATGGRALIFTDVARGAPRSSAPPPVWSSLTRQLSAEQHVLIEGVLPPHDRCAVLGRCDAVLGGQRSDIVVAAVAGKLPVAVSDEAIVVHLMEELGMPGQTLPPEQLTADSLIRCLTARSAGGAQTASLLPARVRQLQERGRADVATVGAAAGGELAPPTAPSHTTRGLGHRSVIALAERSARDRQTVLQLQQENRLLNARIEGLVQQSAWQVWKARKGSWPRRMVTCTKRCYYAMAKLIRRIVWRLLGAIETGGAPSPAYAAKFYRYLKQRNRSHRPLDAVRCPTSMDTISVVLPVFNGAEFLAEAIDSVLAQTHEELELIIVNDGSTDRSPEMIQQYAETDRRITVIHQANQGLPRALSNGFCTATGSYLTWISHDNRLQPEFLERMLGILRSHPEWDMIYANMDLIDTDGNPLTESSWYVGRQVPPGSHHIHLPATALELNTWPDNTVGAAFLYRARVPVLLGDYSSARMTVEDYDYWMLVNEFLTLRHAGFQEPLYEYRFHPSSLTSSEDPNRVLALRERTMVFDDFRRDLAVTPMIWMLEGFPQSGVGLSIRTALEQRIRSASHLLVSGHDPSMDRWPALWLPLARVQWQDDLGSLEPPAGHSPATTVHVLLTGARERLPAQIPPGWDLCATVARDAKLVRTERPYTGWYEVPDPGQLFTMVDIRARTRQIRAIESELHSSSQPRLEASVVISTFRRPQALARALRSLTSQTLSPDQFEIIVVNNDPESSVEPVVRMVRDELGSAPAEHLQLLDCPVPGLSHARNVGIGAARGQVVAFLDDDAVAEPDWLEELLAPYRTDSTVGVVGGRITLTVPADAPDWVIPELWPLWGHLNLRSGPARQVDVWHEFPWGGNWSARRSVLLAIGGFRCGYGRCGDNYGGGEEVVAACLAQRIGARIMVQPSAEIHHEPSVTRFTKTYVRQTVLAGTHVSYQLQRDLYIHQWQGPLDLSIQLVRRLVRIVLRRQKLPGQRLESRARLRADASLLRRMLADTVAKCRFRG